MPTDYVQILVNSSGAVAIAFMFLWYLANKDKRDQRIEERRDLRFIQAINLNTKEVKTVDGKVEKIDRKVDQIHSDHKEDKEIIQKMYEHAVQSYKRQRKVRVAVTT